MDERSLTIIRNPRARRAATQDDLWVATVPLRLAGWHVEIQTTTAPGAATELAAQAARDGAAIVAASGGDGTVYEVANGLAGTETALAVIPGGTANVWASETAIPRDTGRAIELIPTARRERIDLGLVEGAFGRRYFLLMCGLGVDAEVVRQVGQGSPGKRRFGKAWYAAMGARALMRARPVQTAFDLDGVAFERPLLQAVVGKTRLYGGVMRLTSAARVDDGLLDLCALSGTGRPEMARLIMRALRGGLHRHAGGGIDYMRASCLEVRSERPLHVQADGEYLGVAPVTISSAPRALTVLLPQRPNVLLGEHPR